MDILAAELILAMLSNLHERLAAVERGTFDYRRSESARYSYEALASDLADCLVIMKAERGFIPYIAR
jgi:hypothetical protein